MKARVLQKTVYQPGKGLTVIREGKVVGRWARVLTDQELESLRLSEIRLESFVEPSSYDVKSDEESPGSAE